MNQADQNDEVRVPALLLQQTLGTIEYLQATLRYLRRRVEEHYQDPYDEIPF